MNQPDSDKSGPTTAPDLTAEPKGSQLPVHESATPPVSKPRYCVRYEENESKRWDGKEVLIDGTWLEHLYKPSDLAPGKRVILPWQGKAGGKITHWKAIVVDETETKSKECEVKKGKRQSEIRCVEKKRKKEKSEFTLISSPCILIIIYYCILLVQVVQLRAQFYAVLQIPLQQVFSYPIAVIQFKDHKSHYSIA